MAIVNCKCRCGQKIESTIAYKVPINGTKFIFINENHYLKWKDNAGKKKGKFENDEIKRMYSLFVDICEKDFDGISVISKEMEEWKTFCDIGKIFNYLEENKYRLQEIVEKVDFASVSGMIRYIGTIIKKEAPKYQKEKIITTGVDQQLVEEKRKTFIKKRKTLSDLEDEA